MGSSTEIFETRFVRVDGGYVFYPSARRGGVLVTEEEHRRLIERRRNIGRVTAKKASAFFGAIVVAAGLRAVLGSGNESPFIYLPIYLYVAWLLFEALDAAIFGPRRLVAGREEVAPARTRAENRRLVERAIQWDFVLFGIIFTGMIGGAGLVDFPRTWPARAMTIAMVLAFGGYVWLAVRKFRLR